MGNDRTLRKLKKLSSRMSERMEEIRDLMDDMEIEFELMQKQIARLEKTSNKASAGVKKGTKKTESSIDDDEDVDDEDLDLENTTSVFVKPKF